MGSKLYMPYNLKSNKNHVSDLIQQSSPSRVLRSQLDQVCVSGEQSEGKLGSLLTLVEGSLHYFGWAWFRKKLCKKICVAFVPLKTDGHRWGCGFFFELPCHRVPGKWKLALPPATVIAFTRQLGAQEPVCLTCGGPAASQHGAGAQGIPRQGAVTCGWPATLSSKKQAHQWGLWGVRRPGSSPDGFSLPSPKVFSGKWRFARISWAHGDDGPSAGPRARLPITSSPLRRALTTFWAGENNLSCSLPLFSAQRCSKNKMKT